MKFPTTPIDTHAQVANYTVTDGELQRLVYGHNGIPVFSDEGNIVTFISPNSPTPDLHISRVDNTYCAWDSVIGTFANKVTPGEVEAEIVRVTFSRPFSCRTIYCEIETRSGMLFHGSASVQFIEDDDELRGQQAAFNNTLPQVWDALIFYHRQTHFNATIKKLADTNEEAAYLHGILPMKGFED